MYKYFLGNDSSINCIKFLLVFLKVQLKIIYYHFGIFLEKKYLFIGINMIKEIAMKLDY